MKSVAPALLVIATLMFSGCSASEVINTGGDTKCKDFVTQDEKKQNEEVSKMLKDASGTEPETMKVTAIRTTTQTWCQTLGKPDSKISEAPRI